MFTFRVLILLATCLSWSLSKDDYCSICKDHTMCKYKGISKTCIKPESGGVPDKEKKEIVDIHNLFRRKIAQGLEIRGVSGPFPKASNMREIEWDNQLEAVAQRWADQCNFNHDSCRDDKRWKVGQNIFISIQTPTPTVNWTKAITFWYDEVDKFNAKEVQSYRFLAETGHFSQIIWHDSYAIGCGKRHYNTSQIIYVCNYGPAGNWINERVYGVGEPCSECPQGTYCKDDLCGKKVVESVKKNSPQESTNEIEIDEKTKEGLEKIISDLKKLLKGAIRRAKERS